MSTFMADKAAAEEGSIEDSKKFRSRFEMVIFRGVCVVLALCGVSELEQQPIQQRSNVGTTLSMPANGESKRITPPVGHAVAFVEGTGFSIHYVYADGRTGSVGDPTSPQENGHIVAVYLKDKTGKPNWAKYQFVRPG